MKWGKLGWGPWRGDLARGARLLRGLLCLYVGGRHRGPRGREARCRGGCVVTPRSGARAAWRPHLGTPEASAPGSRTAPGARGFESRRRGAPPEASVSVGSEGSGLAPIRAEDLGGPDRRSLPGGGGQPRPNRGWPRTTDGAQRVRPDPLRRGAGLQPRSRVHADLVLQ